MRVPDWETILHELKRGNDVLIKPCKDGYIIKSLASKEIERIAK